MDIDGVLKAVKKLMLTKSMQESSNKLRNSRSLQKDEVLKNEYAGNPKLVSSYVRKMK